jgi:Tfp pilus assembly protein PilX
MKNTSPRGDEGVVATYVMLLAVALMALIGLGVEGGVALGSRQSAYAEAEQAARAGAAALSAASLRDGLVTVADAGAVASAEGYMIAAGHPGTAEVDGDEVIATVTPFSIPTPLLGLAGAPSLTVSASAAAVAVTG